MWKRLNVIQYQPFLKTAVHKKISNIAVQTSKIISQRTSPPSTDIPADNANSCWMPGKKRYAIFAVGQSSQKWCQQKIGFMCHCLHLIWRKKGKSHYDEKSMFSIQKVQTLYHHIIMCTVYVRSWLVRRWGESEHSGWKRSEADRSIMNNELTEVE